MYYRTILSKIMTGIALTLFFAGCDNEEETKTKNEETTVAVESIEVSPASVTLTMILNETVQLTATTVPADANVTVSWVSANDMVATVSASGLVTARKIGQTKVTALGGTVEKSVLVTVVADQSLVTVEPASVTATFGDSPVTLDIKSNSSVTLREILITSSNTSVATVGDNNTVTFVGVGSAEITVASIVISVSDSGVVETVVPVTVREITSGLFGPHTLTSAGITVPMVNFDYGGKGISWFDSTDNNAFNVPYRSNNGDLNCGVDIEGNINSPNIAQTRTGEWLNYTLNVHDAGVYFVSINLSANSSSGKFHIEADGVNFTGTQIVPNNGSWSNWRWQPAGAVYLSAGRHVIKYVVDGNDHNLKDIKFEWLSPDMYLTDFAIAPLNVTFGDPSVKLNIANMTPANTIAKFSFSSSNTNVATVGWDGTVNFISVGSAEIIVVGRSYTDGVEKRVPVTVGPYILTSSGLTIPMVNFDWGGEGVGYHDNDANNRTGTDYRGQHGDPNCGVDIEGDINNPNICYTATGEWLNYTINVQEAGTYRVSISLSSDNDRTGKFHLEADGERFTETHVVPRGNGGWSNWWWLEAGSVYLSAGTHVIRYVIEGNDCNLKAIKFEWQ
jgi:hypothetical protein